MVFTPLEMYAVIVEIKNKLVKLIGSVLAVGVASS